MNVTYVGGDEVGHEVERDAPPDGAEDVARLVLRPTEEGDGVVDLGQVLDEERQQQHRHHQCRRPRTDHRRQGQPHHHLHAHTYTHRASVIKITATKLYVAPHATRAG